MKYRGRIENLPVGAKPPVVGFLNNEMEELGVTVFGPTCCICKRMFVLGFAANDEHSMCRECIVDHPEGYAIHCKQVADEKGWPFDPDSVREVINMFKSDIRNEKGTD